MSWLIHQCDTTSPPPLPTTVITNLYMNTQVWTLTNKGHQDDFMLRWCFVSGFCSCFCTHRPLKVTVSHALNQIITFLVRGPADPTNIITSPLCGGAAEDHHTCSHSRVLPTDLIKWYVYHWFFLAIIFWIGLNGLKRGDGQKRNRMKRPYEEKTIMCVTMPVPRFPPCLPSSAYPQGSNSSSQCWKVIWKRFRILKWFIVTNPLI